MMIAAGVNPQLLTGNQMVLEVAKRLGTIIGPVGEWCFLLGFWGAGFSSMLGVWQGVPYLFSDCVLSFRHRRQEGPLPQTSTHSIYYRAYLLYLSVPPILLVLFGRPVWVVVIYTIVGAFFMPFLAGVLLVMNNRREWVAKQKNSLTTTFFDDLSALVRLFVRGRSCRAFDRTIIADSPFQYSNKRYFLDSDIGSHDPYPGGARQDENRSATVYRCNAEAGHSDLFEESSMSRSTPDHDENKRLSCRLQAFTFLSGTRRFKAKLQTYFHST